MVRGALDLFDALSRRIIEAVGDGAQQVRFLRRERAHVGDGRLG
jgi:hypothetical protein